MTGTKERTAEKLVAPNAHEWTIESFKLIKEGFRTPDKELPAFGGSVATGAQFPDTVEIEIAGVPPFPSQLERQTVRFSDGSTREGSIKKMAKLDDSRARLTVALSHGVVG